MTDIIAKTLNYKDAYQGPYKIAALLHDAVNSLKNDGNTHVDHIAFTAKNCTTSTTLQTLWQQIDATLPAGVIINYNAPDLDELQNIDLPLETLQAAFKRANTTPDILTQAIAFIKDPNHHHMMGGNLEHINQTAEQAQHLHSVLTS